MDRFFVDTNVWYWTSYMRAGLRGIPPRHYQLREYPRYVRLVVRAQAILQHTGLSLGELAHAIEATEFDVFSRTNPGLYRKQFRHGYPAERTKVVAEIDAAWQLIEGMSSMIETAVDSALVQHAISRLHRELLDGYDALVVERLAQAGVNQVITDDADFATVSGLTVFTANVTMLNAAHAQGQLAIR